MSKKIQKISVKKQIKEILKRFDFERVHKVMVALNWTWYSLEKFEDSVIPDIQRLKDSAKNLLWKAAKSPGRISTGGFAASMDSDNCLDLQFIVEEYDGYCSWENSVEFKKYKEK